MSRVLPNAIVGRTFRILDVHNEALEADMPKMVDVGRQKLYGFQHEDGGWGWWFDDESHDYQSAYILFGLAMTREAGYEVDPGVLARGADFLRQRLSTMDPRTRAYAFYSLAVAGFSETGQAQTLAADVLAGKVPEIDPFSQAALALALHLGGDEEQAQALVQQMASKVVVVGDQAHWGTGVEDGHYREKTMSSSTRATALALDALVHIQPSDPLIPQIVRWLMAQRQGSSWGTTQETSYALLGLSDYVLDTQLQASQQNYRVDVNGVTTVEGSFFAAAQGAKLVIPGTRLQPGENVVRLLHGGDGRLYYTVLVRSYTASPAIAASGQIGVHRSYNRPGGKPITAPLRVGDLVEVRLTITLTEEAWYLIVNDPLPAGLEGINERLATTSYAAHGEWEEGPAMGQYPYSRKDVRDDAVSLFITQLGPGKHTFTYLARATVAGTFHALPAESYPMYRPEFWGRSAGDVIEIRN